VRRSKQEERAIARERIARLLALADEATREGTPERATRYVHLARRVGMKYVVRLSPAQRRRVCRRCEAFLVPGKTSRVRLREGKVAQTCLACGTVRRFGYSREQRARRRARHESARA